MDVSLCHYMQRDFHVGDPEVRAARIIFEGIRDLQMDPPIPNFSESPTIYGEFLDCILASRDEEAERYMLLMVFSKGSEHKTHVAHISAVLAEWEFMPETGGGLAE